MYSKTEKTTVIKFLELISYCCA